MWLLFPERVQFHEGENVGTEKEPEKEPEPVLEVGKWCLVEYDAELFPGTITKVCGTIVGDMDTPC